MSGITRTLLAILATTALGVAAATALGAVTVYNNDFSSRAEVRELKKAGGGKRCDGSWRKKGKALRASVKRSPATCAYRIPVMGDAEVPNHDVTVDGRILAKTAKAMRRAAFIEATVRAGGKGSGYSLKVFPDRRRYELTRSPRSSGFPVAGRSNAINRINKRNRLGLTVTGGRLRAVVNGEVVARAEDPNVGQVTGRRIRFAIGSERKKKKSKPVVGTFHKVTVAVPNP